MNLLFTRSQMRASGLSLIPLRIGGTVTFKLRAELELSDEERLLAIKYSLTRATLLRSKDDDDLGRAYRPAIFLTILIMLGVVMFVPTATFGRGADAFILKAASVPAIGLISFLLLTMCYFSALRTYVTVDQLRNGGRMFYCHSVVELDEREAEILDVCRRFYLTLEKAKNWGGREINPLPDGEPFYLTNPDGDEQRVVLDRVMHEAGAVTRKLLTPFTVKSGLSSGEDGNRAQSQSRESGQSGISGQSRPDPYGGVTGGNTPPPSPPQPPSSHRPFPPGSSTSPQGPSTSAPQAPTPRPGAPQTSGPLSQPPQSPQKPQSPPETPSSRPPTLHPSHPLAPKPPDDGKKGF